LQRKYHVVSTQIIGRIKNVRVPFNTRVLQLVDDEDMKIKWRYFLKNIHLKDLSFEVVMRTIANFLQPVYKAIVTEDEVLQKWDCKKQEWSKRICANQRLKSS